MRWHRYYWMQRPLRLGEDNLNDIPELSNGLGEKYPRWPGWTWERVPRREVGEREAEGWRHTGAPIPRKAFGPDGFPL